MSLFRIPRRIRRPLTASIGEAPLTLMLPDPDDTLRLLTFGDAAALGLALFDSVVEREILVLLDEHRRITAMVVDPPAEVGLLAGRCLAPVLDVPFCQTLVISYVDRVDDPAQFRDLYLAVRRAHVVQGLQLIDMVLVALDRTYSLAIAHDPDPVWFDPVMSADAA